MRAAFLAICTVALLTVPVIAGTKSAPCDVHRAPCVAVTESGMEVAFSIVPRPVRVMQYLEFQVSLTVNGKPVTGAALVLDLSMPGMFMGNNQPKLREVQGGLYRGHGVIPRCATGQRSWTAFVAVKRNGLVEKVSFPFEVQ